MKAKLIKYKQEMFTNYILKNEDRNTIACSKYPFATETEYLAKSKGITLQRLSHENCDEIFGIIDVEKLAEEYGSKFAHSYDPEDFIAGFNKAMELNKDKVFTLEDMMNCWNKALKFQEHKQTLGEYIHSLQQPNEIEVEIVMVECENPNCKNGTSSENGNDPILCKSCGGCGKSEKPKLDSEGCLVLTKKI